ncbi:VAN3-binding protein-like [Nymphaea colorata]|nr:VAN3-binding protein-like [Nymphaea colorata]
MDNQLPHLNHGRVSFALDYPMHSLKGLEIMTIPSSSQATQKVKHSKKGKSLHGIDFAELPTSDPDGLNTLGEPSFDFLQLLPLSLSDSTILQDQLAKFKEEHQPREQEEEQDSNDVDSREMVDGETANLREATISRVGRDHYLWLDNIRNWLSTQGYLRSLFERNGHQPESRIRMHFMKEWLRGSSISTLVKEYKQKRKDQLRIRRAQAHAALSVAEVAAAIAGFAANSGNSWDPALASAASLVAAVCAKAAESMGADRTHVSLIIDSAVGSNSTSNILSLTDSAPTCSRCAAMRRYKAQTKLGDSIYQNAPLCTPQAGTDNTETHEYCSSMTDEAALSKGADLLVKGGKKALPRKVSITFKQERVVLKLAKKCFGGAFTTSKQYHIKDVPHQLEEGSFYLLKLETADGGTICIFFSDKRQRDTWGTTITYLLINKDRQ